MAALNPKVSIIGCGYVGTKYAYALAIKGLARQIVMVDVNRERLESDVMDIAHGAPFFPPVEVRAGSYSDIDGSDLVVIAAGKNLLPGQTRLDIARANTEIFKKIIPEIVRHAPDAVLLVVTNPIDVLSYVTYRVSGKEAGSVIGSGTVLDSARLRYLLGQHCTIDPRHIHAYVIGEHGDSEFPAWSCASVGGVLFSEYCVGCKDAATCQRSARLEAIFNDVRTAAYKIIKGKGETSFGVGLSLVKITQAILRDENAVLPVSSLMNGYGGVNDVYMGLPAVINKGGVRETLKLGLNAGEQQQFRSSADTVKRIIAELGF